MRPRLINSDSGEMVPQPVSLDDLQDFETACDEKSEQRRQERIDDEAE